MDLLFVSGLDFREADAVSPTPQIGQSILQRILAPYYDVKLVNFDHMAMTGELPHQADYNDTLQSMTDYLIGFHPKLIGFYTICNAFISVLELSRRIHEQAPEIRIFYGGPHATLTARECLEAFDFLELVCLGESEKSILPLMRAMLDGAPMESVPGIAWRRDGEICFNPCAPLLTDEELQQYTVMDFGPDYPLQERDCLSLEGGRGCPFACSFCSTRIFWKQRFRVKPAQVLIREMDDYHARYGTEFFSIEHDMFTANRKHILEFCHTLIDRGTPYHWNCSSRVDVLDPEMIHAMAQAGCLEIYLGVETGSPRMQTVIHKNLKLDRASEIAACCVREKLYVTASFIYGMADETEEDLLQTLDLMGRFYLSGVRNLQLHRFFPLPATEETAKIRDRLYFDENEIDVSILDRRIMTDEGRELIRRYPELFCQYYTFRSEVRQKYSWADSLAILIAVGSQRYYLTCRVLVRELGLGRLYRENEPVFRTLSLQFSSMNKERKDATIAGVLGDLVRKYAFPAAEELYRFEADVDALLRAGKKETAVRQYNLDIPALLKRGQYVFQPTQVALIYDEGRRQYRAVPVPAWMKVEEGENTHGGKD